jgi:hypothetical protein
MLNLSAKFHESFQHSVKKFERLIRASHFETANVSPSYERNLEAVKSPLLSQESERKPDLFRGGNLILVRLPSPNFATFSFEDAAFAEESDPQFRRNLGAIMARIIIHRGSF